MTVELIARLQRLIDGFSQHRVMVIGDVMLDEYLHGQVDRVSPEAPVPVVALKEQESQPGGAANVALNCLSLGAQVALIGLYGQDRGGEILLEALRNAGLSADGLVKSDWRRTTRKTRIMAQGQQLLRVDVEDDAPTRPAELEALWSQVESSIEAFAPEVIIFEDYDKGALSEELISRVVGKAKSLGIPTVVDPKLRNFWSYKDVSLLKPNLKEVRAALPGMRIDADDAGSLAAAHQALQDRLGHRWSLVTLGADGAFMESESGHLKIAAHRRRIADVCGAGDSVVATAALSIAAGGTAEEILELANLAGGLACEYVGVRPLSRSDFARGLNTVEGKDKVS